MTFTNHANFISTGLFNLFRRHVNVLIVQSIDIWFSRKVEVNNLMKDVSTA